MYISIISFVRSFTIFYWLNSLKGCEGKEDFRKWVKKNKGILDFGQW